MLPDAFVSDPPHPPDTLTFVFTDIEGSTRKWEDFPETMRVALPRHDALMRQAIESNDGRVFKTVGDAFCAVFPETSKAISAVMKAHHALAQEIWEPFGSLRVRVGIHSGTAEQRDNDYFGPTLNRVARLQGIGYGGQTLLSAVTASLVCDALPEGVWLKDLGSHRLKDLGRPEHVFQICSPGLPDEFPPVRSLQAFANNLPVQVSSFVGRGPEMADLNSLLDRHRLVTLLGPGGTGKTRLALQVAAERLEEYGDGVWFIDLAPLADPDLVPGTLANALGVREEAGRSFTETLADDLRPKKTLLILDNCEHVLKACAALAQKTLQACPSVRMLATSREALNVSGEQVWRVPALSVPDPNRLPIHEKDLGSVLLEYDAVRLFVDRARAQKQDFVLRRENADAVAQICRRLDGIPLALELAAARVRALSAEQINERLDDRFRLLTGGARTALPRQQTLRALIDWSYDLLSGQEKTLLERLSVFAGGWSLKAAEAVCAGEGIEDWETLDLLTSLVDKSLVVFEEDGAASRYRLLETVRDYAGAHLAASGGAADVRERHRDFYLALAEEAEPHLSGPEQGAWLSRLETEHDNLRDALSWCAAQAERDGAEPWLRLCVSLLLFWDVRGYFSEGRQWLGRVLTWTEGLPPSLLRARTLHSAGFLAWYQGDAATARALFLESLSGARQLGAASNIADALNGLGLIAHGQSDYHAARMLFEGSLALKRQAGDRRGVANVLSNLGNVAFGQSDFASARALFEESLAQRREIGDQAGIARSLGNLGIIASEQGDRVEGQALYEESLDLFRQIGDQRNIANTLHCLGNLAYDQGNVRTAHALFEESLTLFRQVGDLDGVAYTLEGLAAVSSDGDAARAARIWGAAGALRARIGSPLSSYDFTRHQEPWESARESLGEDAFASALASGEGLTLEQAVADAHAGPPEAGRGRTDRA